MLIAAGHQTEGRAKINWHWVALVTFAFVIVGALLLLTPFWQHQPSAPIDVAAASVPAPPRIPYREYSPTQRDEIFQRFYGLKGAAETCANGFISSYHRVQFDYCVAIDAGSDIGGGCSHATSAIYLDPSVHEAAVAHCSAGN